MQTRDTRGRAGESPPCLGKDVAAPGQGGVGRRTGPTRCRQGFPAGESDRGRGFLHRVLGNLWWRNTSPLFHLLMRDKVWDGPQHSENWGRAFLISKKKNKIEPCVHRSVPLTAGSLQLPQALENPCVRAGRGEEEAEVWLGCSPAGGGALQR